MTVVTFSEDDESDLQGIATAQNLVTEKFRVEINTAVRKADELPVNVSLGEPAGNPARIETIVTSKKASPEAIPDEPQSRRNRGKTVRRSLVEASEAQDAALLARELRTSQTQQELAVVVEFTGELRKTKMSLQKSRFQCL